jgi:hypothetical protein
MKRLLFLFAFLLVICRPALAQEFEIKRYDLNARVDVRQHLIEVQSRLQMVNLSAADLLDKLLLAGADKPRLTLFLNPKAKVASMTVNGASVPLKTAEDARNNVIRVSTDITSAITSAREFEVGLTYTIDAKDRTQFLRVSEGEVFALPSSFWFPVIHTPFGEHGADTAPFGLTVTAPAGHRVVSSGIRKSDTAFEQSLAALPFFVTGDFDLISKGGDPALIEVYAQKGLDEGGMQQAQRLLSEAERSFAFLTKYFGVPAGAPWRAISVSGFGSTSVSDTNVSQSRESSYVTTGTLILDDSYFKRDVLDLGTIEIINGSASRIWIDGRVLLRGRGAGMLRDALPTYLIARYLGERNGEAELEAAFERYRRAYAPLARGSDAALNLITSNDRNYASSMFNKGALVWRLFEKRLGQQTLDATIRQVLDRQQVDVLTLAEWRGPLCGKARCGNVRSVLQGTGAQQKAVTDLFAQWIESVVVPDFAIGQPQKGSAGMESTIVNFGNGDFDVDVVAVTDKGEKLRLKVTVKGGEYGTIAFPSDKNIVAVEADPQKIIPQKDYSNDSFPRKASASDLFGQANVAFSKNDLVTAEAKAREALASDPDSPSLEAFLGRVLLAAKKNADGAAMLNTALKNELLPLQAYAWAHLGLGALAVEEKKPVEAARHFRLAAAADIDPVTTMTARNGMIAAETEAGAIKIPDEVRAFLKQMDAAILQSSAEALNPNVDLGNLRRFAQSLVIRKPAVWVSEPSRVEALDQNRLAVDVGVRIKLDNKDYSGRAVYILRRVGGKLLLGEVPIFDVK